MTCQTFAFLTKCIAREELESQAEVVNMEHAESLMIDNGAGNAAFQVGSTCVSLAG